MQTKATCVICGGTDEMGVNGLGNNPYPIEDKGRCCDLCNRLYVIPQRMEDIHNAKIERRMKEKTPTPSGAGEL